MATDALNEDADHLYGLAPEEFTAARNARARELKACSGGHEALRDAFERLDHATQVDVVHKAEQTERDGTGAVIKGEKDFPSRSCQPRTRRSTCWPWPVETSVPLERRQALLEELAAEWHPPLNLLPVTQDVEEAREWFESMPAVPLGRQMGRRHS
ncbi:hypothetical protein J7E29_02365 [Streptomyces sp. ISL-90]|nr:hypothetical protein [Streptomyces sp. ISL-90]